MRRVEHLIRQIRRQTDNEILGTDDGISPEEILQYINNGQEDIQGAIYRTHKPVFHREYIFDAVGGQEKYPFPRHVWLESSQVLLEWSDTGRAEDFRPLDFVQTIERRSINSDPIQYMLYGQEIVVSPFPTSAVGAKFRLTYNLVVPKVDPRRSQVSAVTEAGGIITALTLDNAYASWNLADWLEDDYLCLCDSQGNSLARGIAYTTIAANGVVTLDGDHTLYTGESATVGDYVVRGKNATTNSQLTEICEKYLIEYASHRILHRDESEAYTRQAQHLMAMRADIVADYAMLSQDIHQIPILTYEYF